MGVLVKLLLSKLAPFEGYLWAVLGAGLFILFYNHHERQIGAAKILAAVKVEADKRAAEVAKVQADAKIQIDGLEAALVVASAPRPNPTHIMCGSPKVQSIAGGSTPSAISGGHEAGGSGSGVEGPGAETPEDSGAGEGVDIGPDTEDLLTRLGAKLAYLQGYIRVCQDKRLCAKE